MGRRRHRKRALARRYGHFSQVDIDAGVGRVRAIVAENPTLAAAAIGGTVGALAAGASPVGAALVGVLSSVTTQQVLKASRGAS
jgi:hypothetical protein